MIPLLSIKGHYIEFEEQPRPIMALAEQEHDRSRFPRLIHGWITEGFDTADLKEAKSLLEELS